MKLAMQRFLVFPRFKYPKFAILLASYFLAYLIFSNRDYPALTGYIETLGYLGIFLAGILYSDGFTSGPAAALIFLMSKNLNIFAAGIIGGLGSLMGDYVIFEFIRTGFQDEIQRLSQENLFRNIRFPKSIEPYILPILAGIFIASPLPDEIGVSMLATSKISGRKFAVLSFLLNTAGIFVILLLGA
jgi:uncharacterized membrane protein YdjX (TVP38/TMEM64 family)